MMTKAEIIDRLWCHIRDLENIMEGRGEKTKEQVDRELDLTELFCRPYADADDEEKYSDMQSSSG